MKFKHTEINKQTHNGQTNRQTHLLITTEREKMKSWKKCVFFSGALTCYQCNVFIRGSPWPCDSDRGMREISNCYACLKTYTRTYLHNTFHDELRKFNKLIHEDCELFMLLKKNLRSVNIKFTKNIPGPRSCYCINKLLNLVTSTC